MPEMVQASVYAYTQFSTLNNQTAITRRLWYCQTYTSTGGVATTADTLKALDDAHATFLKAIMANTASYRGAFFRRVSGSAPFEINDVYNANAGIGVAGANAMASQVCGMISLFTGFIGRNHEGRMYTPFPSTADDGTTGQPSAGFLTSAASLAQIMVTPLTFTAPGGGIVTMVPTLKPASPSPQDIITSYKVRPRWATQKRRGDYGRPNPSPI